MRIVYFSDIHREMFPTRPIEVPEADVVILAGDIGTFRDTTFGNAIDYANELAQDYGDVVLVPGNHEYYHTSFREARKQALSGDDAVSNVHVLDRGEVKIGKLRILGATLWTDYKISGNQMGAMAMAASCITDHRLIQATEAHGFRFMPRDALNEHIVSRTWLLDRLAEPWGGETIVVTHHGPSAEARNTKYPLDHVTAAFTSDCVDVIEAAAKAKVRYWIFGHDHACHDVTVNGVRLLSAQLGYLREETGWKGPGVIDL